MEEPVPIKVVLVGDSGVGKTSIISQFTTNRFDPLCPASLNSQFTSKILEFKEYNQALKFDIWDTVGQEQYRSLAKIFYKNASVIILIYDITSSASFDSIKNYWHLETKNYANKDPIFVLAANKSDLYKDEKISIQEGKAFADEIKALFMRTSALSNVGINLLFENIGKKLIDPELEIDFNDNLKFSDMSELRSIKSNRTTKTNNTNSTNKKNQSEKKDNKIKLIGNINENEFKEEMEINRKKTCC